jgi:hypothetical protein
VHGGVDNTGASKNNYVYNEMLKEQESSSLLKDNYLPPSNIKNNTSSQQSISYSYSSNKPLEGFDNMGCISPITQKMSINTENNSNQTEEDVRKQLTQYQSSGSHPFQSSFMLKQPSYRSSADQQAIAKELLKHGGGHGYKQSIGGNSNVVFGN